MTYTTLIVGCGDMAGGYDEEREPNAWPLSHAGALGRHADFRLEVCVDPDARKLASFQERWSVPRGHRSLDEVDTLSEIDLVVIASPTTAHADGLEWALARSPRLVFCEKPLTDDFEVAASLVERYGAAQIPLAVNFSRTWDPRLGELSRLGAIRSVSATYSGGVLNNASHLIDLLRRWVGPLELAWSGSRLADGSVPFVLVSDTITVTANVADASDYGRFAIDFHCEQGLFRYDDSGFASSTRRARADSNYADRVSLGPPETLTPGYPETLMRAYDHLADVLRDGEPLASSGHTALETQAMCHLILERSA